MSKKHTEFAERINPHKLNFSPKLTAIVGAIIGYDYGVRDRKGGKLTGLTITSDGYAIASSTASDGGGAFLGDIKEIDRNLSLFMKALSEEDATAFNRAYFSNVRSYQ